MEGVLQYDPIYQWNLLTNSRKMKSTAEITTLRKPDGSLTTDLHEIFKKNAGVLRTGI
jgi:hypothetical protein